MTRVLVLLAAVAAVSVIAASAEAQVVYRATYYAPTVVYRAPAPPVYTVASPVVVPAPTVAYFAPAVPVVEPVAEVRTRYRPILGGTVSRVRYRYAPVYYPAVP